MPRATYIHGTEASEQQRLVALNRLTNEAFLAFLAVPPDAVVLEVGSGLGILASAVAAAADRVRVVGLDLSPAQLAYAKRAASVPGVRGDAHALPFGDRTFDLVFARYLLEHVDDPAVVLLEMKRVLRAGGRVAVMENDVSLVRFDPPCPCFDGVWLAFTELQRQLGGDGLIGRRLYRLLHAAGFRDISMSVQPEVHWFGSPGWNPWIENIIGNVESARGALTARGLSAAGDIDRAVEELRALEARPDGSCLWIWNRARATKS